MNDSGSTVVPLTAPTTPSRSSPHPSTGQSETSPTPNTKEPVALATTKRKFHKLLESITSTSSCSKNAPKNPLDTDAKRIRLEARGRLDALGGKRSIFTKAASSIQDEIRTNQASAARRSASIGSIDTSNGKPRITREPNYIPWSHDYFLQRLKTFADVKLWTPKPDKINELEWAKLGWICIAWNTVACKGGCEQRVVLSLRPARKNEEGTTVDETEDLSVEIDDELVRRYVKLLKTGHNDSCLWRAGGCKDDIFRLPIAKPSIWQAQLRERYESFKIMAEELPPLHRLILPLDPSIIGAQLSPKFFAPESSSEESLRFATMIDNSTSADHSAISNTAIINPINPTALALALFGWTGSPDPALAACQACFRRVGLWLYGGSTALNPVANTSVASNGGGQMEAATEVDIEDTSFKLDLAGNHREYCPWVNAKSQQMQGSFSGLATWQVLARLISNNASRTSLPDSHGSDENNLARGSSESASRVMEGDGQMSVEAIDTTPKKNTKELEKEDKARFARLKELTNLMGLRRNKTKKP